MRGRRRERGHLMLWAAVFGVVAMAYWALAFRATGDCIRAERAALLRVKRDEAAWDAAGIAACEGATPLRDNAHKVRQLRVVVRRAIAAAVARAK